jgi:hypothetical protein
MNTCLLTKSLPARAIPRRRWQHDHGVVDMASPQTLGQLIRATEADVKAWFREAWPGRESYPNEARNRTVATRINTIVDRANARSEKDLSAAALGERREHYRTALKHGRALQRALHPIKENLFSIREMLRTPQAAELEYPPLADEIAAIEEVERSLGEFLARCKPPSLDDHKDEISWIGDAAQKAWAGLPSDHPENKEKALPLGLGPDGPLAGFVQLVLEGIGLASRGLRGSSRETISDHLRGRQKRKRDRKKDKK